MKNSNVALIALILLSASPKAWAKDYSDLLNNNDLKLTRSGLTIINDHSHYQTSEIHGAIRKLKGQEMVYYADLVEHSTYKTLHVFAPTSKGLFTYNAYRIQDGSLNNFVTCDMQLDKGLILDTKKMDCLHINEYLCDRTAQGLKRGADSSKTESENIEAMKASIPRFMKVNSNNKQVANSNNIYLRQSTRRITDEISHFKKVFGENKFTVDTSEKPLEEVHQKRASRQDVEKLVSRISDACKKAGWSHSKPQKKTLRPGAK